MAIKFFRKHFPFSLFMALVSYLPSWAMKPEVTLIKWSSWSSSAWCCNRNIDIGVRQWYLNIDIVGWFVRRLRPSGHQKSTSSRDIYSGQHCTVCVIGGNIWCILISIWYIWCILISIWYIWCILISIWYIWYMLILSWYLGLEVFLGEGGCVASPHWHLSFKAKLI